MLRKAHICSIHQIKSAWIYMLRKAHVCSIRKHWRFRMLPLPPNPAPPPKIKIRNAAGLPHTWAEQQNDILVVGVVHTSQVRQNGFLCGVPHCFLFLDDLKYEAGAGRLQFHFTELGCATQVFLLETKHTFQSWHLCTFYHAGFRQNDKNESQNF